MRYEADFDGRALREWRKLAPGIRDWLHAKLKERAEAPPIPKSALRGMPDCYKIKLRQSGYRLVYRVEDDVLVILILILILVIAIGKRDGNEVYDTAKARL